MNGGVLMFKAIEIESRLELPYAVIDIRNGEEQFILSFSSFDEDQTEHSLQAGGVTGRFDVTYKCRGTDCHFECDLTTGNLYCFYLELDDALDGLPGTKPIAILENYGGSQERTKIVFSHDKTGHWFVSGNIRNKGNNFRSGIFFDIPVDVSIVSETMVSLKRLFDELERIQGHRNFF